MKTDVRYCYTACRHPTFLVLHFVYYAHKSGSLCQTIVCAVSYEQTAGADVNQRLFRGYAATAATREGHYEVLSILLKAGSSQPACEEALLEACLSGQVTMAELLISWEMVRMEVLTSALIHSSSRGLVDIVQLLIKVMPLSLSLSGVEIFQLIL